MRLGTIIRFVPFVFVLNPALIGQGPIAKVRTVACAAIVGIIMIAAGLQGYMIGLGTLGDGSPVHWFLRIALVCAGLILALPGGEMLGFTNTRLNLGAPAVGIPALLLTCFVNRNRETVSRAV